MAERKYQFERLTPTDNIDLDVYEDAINYVFENPDVKNIYNEFVIYFNRLNTTELDYNKMLAIIAYKNLKRGIIRL